MKNCYMYRSRISEKIFRRVVVAFCLDFEASKTAKLCGISRITVNKLYDNIREYISKECEQNLQRVILERETEKENEYEDYYIGKKRYNRFYTQWLKNNNEDEDDDVEDEDEYIGKKSHNSFYTQWVKNKNTVFFGIIEKDEQVHIKFPDKSSVRMYELRPAINKLEKKKDLKGKIVVARFLRSCNDRLSRFRGIHKHKFNLHIAECAFKYNRRNQNKAGLCRDLLTIMRSDPLNFSKTDVDPDVNTSRKNRKNVFFGRP